MIEMIALASLFAIAAPFILYPCALFLRANLAPNSVAADDHTPAVDLIICAHNESASIKAKLENALGLDYPKQQVTIWVASDGSTDETVRIARGFEDRGVRVLDLPRRGKAHALNAAIEASGAEVLAFSDANSHWEPSALRGLMRPLADKQVGGVAGDQRYKLVSDSTDQDAAIGERSYWDFDRRLKNWQSRAGNVISATGAIYAIRRDLYQAPPPDATDDFMISTGVIALGKRLVFCPEAIALEPPAKDSSGEFRRKVRITTRGLRAVAYRGELLNPATHGIYAIELFVHKLWRRLTWIPLLVLFLITPELWSAGGVFTALGLTISSALLIGAIGLARPRLQRFKWIAIPAYTLMVNTACAMATVNAIRGHRVSHWDPNRAVSGSPP